MSTITNKFGSPELRLLLAPMEGVLESVMRDIITEIGGYERCVTEFIRVSSTVLPSRVFYRLCPELKTEGRTASGTPVYVQLLGSDPDLLAENAKVAVGLGALGIDLNFGCPAKTVNKSRGGATLLKTPDQIGLICQRVRDSLPITVPVTAKIRLGYDSDERFEDIYRSAIGAGIDELTIHARTKTQGYRPPAHWQQIAAVNNVSSIPIIANGELWSPGDIAQCRELSGCEAFMLARGALCRPDLGRSVKAECQGRQQSPMEWPEVLDLLIRFLETNSRLYDQKFAANPVKQWLVYLKHYYPQAAKLFAVVKRIRDPQELRVHLMRETLAVAA